MSKANACKPELAPGPKQGFSDQPLGDLKPPQLVPAQDPGRHNDHALDREQILDRIKALIVDQQARVARHARKADKQAFRRGDRVPCADRRWAEAISRLDDLIEIERHLEASASSDARQ